MFVIDLNFSKLSELQPIELLTNNFFLGIV